MTAKNHYRQPSMSDARKRLGVGLFNLAVAWSAGSSLPGTQLARNDAIRSLPRRRKTLDGKSGITHIRGAVESVANQARANRAARDKARSRPWIRETPAHNIGRKPVILPSQIEPDHDARIAKIVQRKVFRVLVNNFRINDHGKEVFQITTDPASVGVRQESSNDWDFYSKRTRYPKLRTDTTVTVPRAWRSRVERRDLAIIDGMMTLDAQPAEGAPEDVELFSAVWVAQGRGFDLNVTRGYIARFRDGTTYHGDSANAALRGIARKIKGVKIKGELNDLLAKHGIGGLVERAPDLTVTLGDARATGACEYGIRSWCNLCGLPYEAGEASIARVYAAYREHPMPEARAALLRALRRQKRAVLKAA